MITTTTIRTQSGSRYVLTNVEGKSFITRMSECPILRHGKPSDVTLDAHPVTWMSALAVGASLRIVLEDQADVLTTSPVESFESDSVVV
jgi:hypothetical protein